MAERYNNMRDVLATIREGYSPKEIKMAIGIASDKRYAGGNMTGAVDAIEKIKKGLSQHKQVAAVLKRQNEDLEEGAFGELQIAAKDLAKYAAQDKRGVDYKDFMKAAAMMKTGKVKELVKFTMDLDTEPRDHIIQMVKSAIGKTATEKLFKVSISEAKEVLSRFRDDKLKQSVMNLAKQKGLKVKDMGDKIEVSGNGRKVMDLTLAVQKQDVKIEELEEAMLNLKLVTYQAKEALGKIRHKVAKKGNKYIISVDSNDEEDAQKAMKDHPLYVAGKLRVVPESVEEQVELEERWEVKAGDHAIGSLSYDDKEIVKVDKKTAAKLQAYFKKTNDGKAWRELFQGKGKGKDSVEDQKSFDAYVKRLVGEEVELEEKLKVSDGLGAWIDDFKKSDAPQFKGKSDEEKKNMAIAAFTDAGGKLDEETLDELREPYAVIDTADDNKVVGTASDEKGAKSIISTSQLPPMKIKDKKTLKIVKVKKKQMIGYPIKEEEEPQKPDSAKEVEQGREDKKKTRIAQLQLQIAKAQETINKLNSQEK